MQSVDQARCLVHLPPPSDTSHTDNRSSIIHFLTMFSTIQQTKEPLIKGRNKNRSIRTLDDLSVSVPAFEDDNIVCHDWIYHSINVSPPDSAPPQAIHVAVLSLL